MRRLIFPLLLGLAGCAVLVSLGLWQVQRLSWKEGILAEISARIDAPPGAVPAAPDPQADAYRPVTVQGALPGEEARVLVSNADLGGAGHRLLSVLVADDRRLLVDLGFVPVSDTAGPRRTATLAVTGNLHWPDEVDGWTPPPDAVTGQWFARDIPAIAAQLRTEPFLIVARDLSRDDLGVTPLPIDTSAIPNDHLNYAITWFLLAAVWAAMTGALIWTRARRI